MHADLKEIADALDMQSDDMTACYYVPEERVIFHSEFDPSTDEFDLDEIDGDDLIRLPDKYEINEYGIMEDFAASVPGEAGKWLNNSLVGKGAFRRFRATLQRFGLEEKWYAYHDGALMQKAMEWCEENGITYDDEEMPDLPEAQGVQKVERKLNVRIVSVNDRNMGGLYDMAADWLRIRAGGKLDMQAGEDFLEDCMEQENELFLASVEGRPVGFCVLEDHGMEVDLMAVYVRKEYRKKGIGRALVKQAESIADECHSPLVLKIHPENSDGLGFASSVGYGTARYMEFVKN